MFDMMMAPEMSMRVTPALLNWAQLLALPSLELQQLVRQELDQNPALEEVEAVETICYRCGSAMIDGVCLNCAANDDRAQADANRYDDRIDPLLFVIAPRSFAEGLLEDLCASLPDDDRPIALELVGNLDEHGFLAEEIDGIATLLNIEPSRVAAVLERLREIGPPGIAACDTRECLLLQIDRLAAQGIDCPYARAMVADHFDDLGAGRFKRIARALKASAAEIDAARSFIRRHLWPYPAQAARIGMAPPQRTIYRTADIAIRRIDGAYMVEVLRSPRRLLRLNPLYRELSRKAATLPEDERTHVQEYIARGRMFLTNLRQREHTLKLIGEQIVERQTLFLRHGIRSLAPMTRAEIAAELGVHESTVSRAVADKTVLLPNGALMALEEFFVAARGVQDILRELIMNETEPLSDAELARRLGDAGHPIARRTVAKYRDRMRIPPAHLR